MDIDFLIQDTFAVLRPEWKLYTSLDEAAAAFGEACKENFKNQQEKPIEAEPPEEVADSDEEADDEDVPVARMNDAQSSDDEVEEEFEAEVSMLPR